MSLLDEHLGWQREQQRAGRVIAAGPTPDLEIGIMVFAHMSRDDLDTLLSTEPFIRAGVREYEVFPWDVHHVLGVGGFDRTTISAMIANEHESA